LLYKMYRKIIIAPRAHKAPDAYWHLALIGIAPVSPRGEYCVGVVYVDKTPRANWNCAGVI
jgi:hypothetical protein